MVRYIAILSLLLLAGCSSQDGPPRYPVRGVVLLDDQPVAEALVVFHPRFAREGNTPQPQAYTDAQGIFALTTLQPSDGAPAGEYAITVELRDQQQVGEEIVRNGPNLLPQRYASPQASGLSHTVGSGVNEVPPLKLSKQ